VVWEKFFASIPELCGKQVFSDRGDTAASVSLQESRRGFYFKDALDEISGQAESLLPDPQ